MKDVIIIGSGPAGVSLALYLKRENYNVTVLTTDNSILKKTGYIENYYGVEKISGEDLYAIGIKQLNDIGVELLKEEVVKIEKTDSFKVYTNLGEYQSKVVVLANGILRTPSGITNASSYEGKGVSYCATCDGFFFRNKKIAVIGNGNLAYDEAKYLKQISNDVILLTNNQKTTRDFSDLNIEIIEDKVSKITGDGQVKGINFDNGNTIDIDGIFIASGVASALTFSKTLGITMNNNYIKVNEDYMTNITGLFAIGDVIGGVLQIGKAVADGIEASKKISKFIKEEIK